VKTETTSPKSESSIKDESDAVLAVEALAPSAVQPKVESTAVEDPTVSRLDESSVKSDESSLKSEESPVKSEDHPVKTEGVAAGGEWNPEAGGGETGGGGSGGESIPQPPTPMPSLEESA
jgi:hypothetical protein